MIGWQELFKKAGLKIVGEQLQAKFPKGLFPVKMFALVPESTNSSA